MYLLLLLLLFDTRPVAVVCSDAAQGYSDVNSFYRDSVRTLESSFNSAPTLRDIHTGSKGIR